MAPLCSASCHGTAGSVIGGTGWGAAVGAVVAEGAGGAQRCRGTSSWRARIAAFAEGIRSFVLSSERLPWTILFFLLLYIVVDKCGSLQVGSSHLGVPTNGSRSVEALGSAMKEPSAGIASGAESRKLSGSEGHPHDVMFFFFNAIIVGIIVTQVKHISWFRGLQQTVVTFFLGMVYSLIMSLLDTVDNADTKLGMLWRSYDMWMHIDPHLLLFAFLPALLAGDAMNIDTSIVRRVASQCILLAGPGVVVNGMSIAVFLWLYLPYDWSFLLSLTTGAILCATDPVATVALLKELGASPTITVQIQGESLLNDGTAIVLYTLAYNMLKGEKYDASDVIIFLVKTAMCAWLLGIVIGNIFLFWMSAANNKFDHHASILQIALSLCCAYWSFIIAEGVLEMSGVLATVAASLVLADKMWHVLVSKESMHTVWEMVEYLGNTLIFFLAGALFGKSAAKVDGQDVGHLLVIYLFCTLIRLIILLLFRPLLRVFGSKYKQDVTITDCLVMTWGGLRGAVGLALAIQVNVERAGTGERAEQISERDAHRVLFYVGGVAALTLMVNATTCPTLVKNLGLTQLPETKQRMLFRIHHQLWRILDRRLRHKPSLKFVSSMFEGVLEKVRDSLLIEEVSRTQREAARSWALQSFSGSSCRLDESEKDHATMGTIEGDPRKSSLRTSNTSDAFRVVAQPSDTSDAFHVVAQPIQLPHEVPPDSDSMGELQQTCAETWREVPVVDAAPREVTVRPRSFKAEGKPCLRKSATAPSGYLDSCPRMEKVKSQSSEGQSDLAGFRISQNGKLHDGEPQAALILNGTNVFHTPGALKSTSKVRRVSSERSHDLDSLSSMRIHRSKGSIVSIASEPSASEVHMHQARFPLNIAKPKIENLGSSLSLALSTSRIFRDKNIDGTSSVQALRRQKIWGRTIERTERISKRVTFFPDEATRNSSKFSNQGSTFSGNRFMSMISAFSMRSTRRSDFSMGTSSTALRRQNNLSRSGLEMAARSSNNIVNELADERNAFQSLPERDVELLGDVGKMPSYDEELKLITQIMANEEEPLLLRAINEAFLNLVNVQYWEQIQAGHIVSGTHEASILLSSIKLALSQERVDLCDFFFIKPYVERPLKALSSLEPLHRHSMASVDMELEASLALERSKSSARGGSWHTVATSALIVKSMVENVRFQFMIMCAVVANAIFIGLEEALLEADDPSKGSSGIGWVIADAVFTTIFTIECLLMICCLKMKYFCNGWNMFDFFLVLLGWFGVVVNILVQADIAKDTGSEHTDVSNEGRLVRVARVFRVLRLLRVFRLLKFVQVLKAKFLQRHLSLETAEHIQKITVLLCFAKAHQCSQQALVQFFGFANEVDSVEIAHCILQSQVETYKALSMAVSEQQELDARLVLEKEHFNILKETAENLENFVTSAHKGGVLTANEAESVLRPLRKVVKKCNSYIKNAHLGFVTKPTPAQQNMDALEALPEVDDDLRSFGREDSHTFMVSAHSDFSLASDVSCKPRKQKTVQFSQFVHEDEPELVVENLPNSKMEQQNETAAEPYRVDEVRVMDA